jgi:hypothetical protein
MGLLDDAIREHLELKRRRGADPAEVEKQEREALGPIGAPPVEERELPVDEAPPVAVHDDDEPPPVEDVEDDFASYDGVPLDEERDALRRDPAAYDDDPDPFEDAHAPLHDDPPPPPPAPPLRDELQQPPPSQPTEQYSVEDLEELRRSEEEPRSEDPADEATDEAAEGEDVLDETPDFLQEAPEHDRLWFEQRPPRDFDF